MAESILNNHLKFEKAGTALQHLSDDQIVELMTEYYFSFEKVSDLLNKYLIKNTPPGRLFLLFPPIETDKICYECGKKIHLLFAAKTTDYVCADFFTGTESDWRKENCYGKAQAGTGQRKGGRNGGEGLQNGGKRRCERL